MREEFYGGRVVVLTGDITAQRVYAIVNAANATLLGGGGVDGAIHDKGGRAIYDECLKLRETRFPKGLPTGEAVISTAGELPARFVIHTVGPIYGRDRANESRLLGDCYRNSLRLAAENDLATIAFPSIATGAYGYPKHEAARVASAAIQEFLAGDDKLSEIRLVFFGEGDARKFLAHNVF